MDVAKWQKQLEDTFSMDGIVGTRLMTIIEMEKAYSRYVINKFHGYRVLTDSYFDFYMETLQLANDKANMNDFPSHVPSYSSVFLFYVMNFRRLRAAENLFLCGYPLDGYALLRDMKDRAICIGAVINRLGSFSALFLGERPMDDQGKELTRDEYIAVSKDREKKERAVRKQMIGEESGLTAEQIYELKRWEKLFHEEVHGSRFSYFMEGGPWLKGEKTLSLGPIPNNPSVGMYMNRSSEIDWMIFRTLPFLQLSSGAFGEEWARKWRILDESFKTAIEELGHMKKKIAWAIIEVVNRKFNFSLESVYFEIAENDKCDHRDVDNERR